MIPGDVVKRYAGVSFKVFAALAALYLFLAYFLLPVFLRHYEHRPELETFPKTSFTREGLPADPFNVGFLCSRSELMEAMNRAGWKPADPLKISSDLKIAEDILLKKSYPEAPLSSLYLFNRTQDFAFEKEVGGSPAKRHHVRFWKTEIVDKQSRPLWIGSTTYDKGVGVNHYNGQLTHHIDQDIDKERDDLVGDLKRAGQLTKIYQVSGVGLTVNGYNGGGDKYFTDGELTLGVVSRGNIILTRMPQILSNPVRVEVKDSIWNLFRDIGNKK